jgi:pimeloyl-ACP methyl ester carboxylesterase
MPGYTESADDFEGGAGRLAGSRWAPDGPSRGVVLLLHGGGQTRHSWGEAGPALAADGWTAVAIDFRGHGDSDRVDAMAEDVPDWAEMDRLSARIRDAAAAVRIPVLLVRGQLSDVVSADGVADLLATIPHARYTDVAGTGHMVAGDDKSVFLERVGEFLDGDVG